MCSAASFDPGKQTGRLIAGHGVDPQQSHACRLVPLHHSFCLMHHTGSAGEVWRNEKASDFGWRVRCLGADGDPAVAALLAQIEAQTAALNETWAQQQASESSPPWWADGEYDDAEADRWAHRPSAAPSLDCTRRRDDAPHAHAGRHWQGSSDVIIDILDH